MTLDLGATDNLAADGQMMVVLGGSAGDTITGSAGADVINGNGGADTLNGAGGNDNLLGGAGDDTLDGGTGADTMTGGLNDDVYVVDNVGDTVVEAASAGTDTVQSSIDYTLGDNLENLTLTGAAIFGTGNALNNTITGNAQDNELDGQGGTDAMAGGAGNDTYVVDSTDDAVTEADDAGTDLVRASASYTLSANVENLTLTGSADIDGFGNDLANVLTGNDGANLLDGGMGADTMAGGLGDDTYVVDNVGDVVTEEAAGGTDTVQSSISYALGLDVENLTLTGDAIYGTGNDAANIIIGNVQDNELDGGSGDDSLDGGDGGDTLTGGIGNDMLDGGAGADLLIGGSGNDTYIVDDIGDIVSESGGPGIDTVFASIGYTLGNNVENLTLTTTANLYGMGNALGNTITGNDGNNIIDGKAGNDVLTGGAGDDTFYFSTALSASTNVDQITDFGVGDDVFNLVQWVFTATSPGTLAESAFHVGASATDADQRIIYDQASGHVMYDADDNGGGAAVQFAAVTAGTLLTHDDFFIL